MSRCEADESVDKEKRKMDRQTKVMELDKIKK